MNFAERMRKYEQAETSQEFMEQLPVLARMDGRAFHRFAGKLEKPYDATFHQMMVETTVDLLWETGAQIGYTTSDEITICWTNVEHESQMMFGRKKQKLVSSLAAMTTAFFSEQRYHHNHSVFIENAGAPCTFDARVWTVPTATEAINNFLWREQEATKNSISMAARTLYSQKELDGKTSKEQQEMMWTQGINWNEFPADFKRGTYLIKTHITVPFTVEEIEKLPPKHHARTNPELEYKRNVVKTLDIPPLEKIQNQYQVLIYGNEPIADREEYLLS
jgi:tRNA(His) 5'-end guanylyltransferase